MTVSMAVPVCETDLKRKADRLTSTSSSEPIKTETRLSALILFLLALAGTGIFLRQFQINPAVIALRPESQELQAHSEPSAVPPIDVGDSGIVAFSPPEQFGPDTLFEKINGRADLYLATGFVRLDAQRFTADTIPDDWVEVFVYDMDTPENAFSVFSTQRRSDALPDKVAPFAYRTENALFMVHEHHYLEFIGTAASEAVHAVMGTLAQRFIDANADTTTPSPVGANLFPALGMVPDSLQLIAANAFGHEQLDRIYTADYLIDDTHLTAFASDRQTPDAASDLADDFRRALIAYGATQQDGVAAVADAAVLQFFDTYEIIFTRGRYLVGVHEAETLEAAVELARRLAAHMETDRGEK
jgi:hypothetical protein